MSEFTTYTNESTGAKVQARLVKEDETVITDAGPTFAPAGTYLTDQRQVFPRDQFEQDHGVKREKKAKKAKKTTDENTDDATSKKETAAQKVAAARKRS